MKETMDLDFTKIKNFCVSKDTIKKMKKPTSEKVFAKYKSESVQRGINC